VRSYIAGQEKHHRKISFQDEVRELLRRYEIEFDERYVWD
jgi:putative transposase